MPRRATAPRALALPCAPALPHPPALPRAPALPFVFALSLLCALALALPAAAQDLPALHDVRGVASDDVLNIRAAPDAGSAIVGTLAHDQTGVEVTATQGNWGRVNAGEGAGWASLDFLAPVTGGAFPEAPNLACFGTEPFWRVTVTQDGLSGYSDAEGETLALLAGPVTQATGMRGRYGLVAAGPDGNAALAIRPEACNDGMSDRAFGLSVEVILSGRLNRVLSGCCSVATD